MVTAPDSPTPIDPLIAGVLASQPTTTTHHHHTHQQTPYSICGASDLHNYVELCEAGHLYQYLWGQSNGMTLRDCIPADHWHPYASDRPLYPGDIKRQFLVMLFADKATTQRIRLFDILRAEFPTVADFIMEAKCACYQELARRCQRMESQIIIDGACCAILRNSPGTVILTIHDAILTTRSDAEMVADSIRTEFKRWGVTPSFHGTEQS